MPSTVPAVKRATTKKAKHVAPWGNATRLSVSLPVAVLLLVVGVALTKLGWDDYNSPNTTGPYSPEVVNLFMDPAISLSMIELRTIVISGAGMAAVRYALNRWMKDEDASSIVAILFSLWLGPVGVVCLSEMYAAGTPLEIGIQGYRTSLLANASVAEDWATHMARTSSGGNIFNGYITYELVWELAVYGLSNPTNLYHHTVFLLLSGGFCMNLCYSYLGMSFMIMEISTIPLKVRRLSFRKDYSGRPGLKRLNDLSTLLFAVSFAVTRIGHMAWAGVLFFGWMADGSIVAYSPGVVADIAVAVLVVGAFALQCFWFSLMLKKCIPGQEKLADGGHRE